MTDPPLPIPPPPGPTLSMAYVDCDGRELIVTGVDLEDRLGRQVIGTLKVKADSILRAYSCTIGTWAKVWRDKEPRADPRSMKIG